MPVLARVREHTDYLALTPSVQEVLSIL